MNRLARLIVVFAVWLPVAWNAGFVSAEEPAREFLEALRTDEHPYFDIAIEYLASLENSDLVSDEFKSALPFERAQTLIGSTTKLRDLAIVEKRLDEAQQLLTSYADANQSLEVNARTLEYRGNLLYQRSGIYLKQSESDRLTSSEKDELFEKARGNLEQSLESYNSAKAQIRRLIDPDSPDAVRIDPQDPSTRRRRDQFQTTYAQVRFRVPSVIERLAETYSEGDPNRKRYLQSAAAEYQKVYDAYPKYMAGLNACVSSARSNQKLDDHESAIELLNDIFTLGNNSVFKPVKLKAYVLATESWQAMKPYPYNEVIRRLEPAVKVLNRVDLRNPDWLRVKLELGIAKKAKSVEIKQKGGPTASSDADKMERAAGKILRDVARVPNPSRDRAKELMADWGIRFGSVAESDSKAPATFDDARQKGRDLIGDIEVSLAEVKKLRQRLASEKDPAKKAELKPQYDEAVQAVSGQTKSALELFDLALSLADDSTVRADINNVRYLQSYCYFAAEQYFESALISEFLLAKYPTVEGTKQAMALMIRSYAILLDAAKDKDKAFERRKLENACVTVVDRWPGSNESGAAASTMTRLALNEKDFVTAQKYFEQIPSSASYRDAIGVRLGQTMWFDYKAKLKALGGQAEPAELAQQLKDSRRYLSEGLKNADVQSLDYETALGALLLVDVFLKSGEVNKAINRLEDAAIAPLDLVKQKHPVVTNTSSAGLYRREAYKTAVKAYLAAMEGSTDQQKWIDKAGGVIKAMRDEVKASNDPADRARVTAIYQLIAKELKENFESISVPAEKQKFSGSLASFLGAIEKESADARTVLWAGSTLLGVAESLSQSGLDATALFSQAVSALTRAESIGFAGDPQEKAMSMELKRQRALAERGRGKFEAAVDQFAEILAESSSSLTVQLDAAETLQAWAKSTSRPKGYVEAIKGAKAVKDPKTKRMKKLIWGWERIAKATRSNIKFRTTFYKSLYHIAECRMEYGLLEDNQKAIVSAGNEIANERRRDPTFNGNAQWKAKFEALEVRIKEATK